MKIRNPFTPLVALLFLWLFGTASMGFGQAQYYVYFKDKPAARAMLPDFDEKALERRQRHNIPFPQADDYAVDTTYVMQVAKRVTGLRHALRWWNCVTVEATEAEIAAVRLLDCVKLVEAIRPAVHVVASLENGGSKRDLKLERLYRHQRKLMNMDTLRARGLTGKGVRIAVLDAGFKGADTHPAFAHLHEKGRILASRDFFSEKKDAYFHSGHGTAVLSCIAGYFKGRPLGAAPDAEFLLARTEHNLWEPEIEEDHWLAAMEWADTEGADMISASLGYAKKRYTYSQMDGRTTKVTRAAALAVRKGMLVVNSAGNEGGGKFRYLAAPADADSVLSVGGSYPMVRYPMWFSSHGPNYRKVLKPEIAAPGVVVGAHKKGGYKVFPGTSFSCPLITGLAAALMQADPAATNMEIRQQIIELGHFYPYYDYRLGYGVPDAARLWHPADSVPPTFEVRDLGDTLFVRFLAKFDKADSISLRSGKPFHFHLRQPDGVLKEYRYFRVREEMKGFKIPRKSPGEGRLHIWYEGYYWVEE